MDIPHIIYNIYYMGMFDTVVIENLKLPSLPKEVSSYLKSNNKQVPSEFQTKDLDNTLSTFTVDSSGQIFVTEYKPTGKKIPYNSPFTGWTDNRSFLERLYFKFIQRQLDKKHPVLKTVDERKPVKIKVKTTSTFGIYTYEEVGGRYLDIEFNVIAVEGKVKKINLIKAEIESEKAAKARKKQNEEFEQKLSTSIAKRNAFRAKWYYPIVKEIYNPFVFFSTKIIQKICHKISNLTYRWTGV